MQSSNIYEISKDFDTYAPYGRTYVRSNTSSTDVIHSEIFSPII